MNRPARTRKLAQRLRNAAIRGGSLGTTWKEMLMYTSKIVSGGTDLR